MLPTLLFVLASTGFAVPTQHVTRSSEPLTDTFDGVDASIIPLLSKPIGEQNGLLYSRWVYGTAAALSGVLAKSPPNVASIGIASHLTSGPDSLDINANITITGKTKYFDLLDLYYGCRLYTATPAVGTSETCIFSATGIDSQGNAVSEETFTFVPVGTGLIGSLLSAPMNYKAFPKFRKMVSVDIKLAESSSSLASVMLIDNVRHVNYE